MARKLSSTTKVLMLATMAAAWAPAYAADANPADVAQADKFLAKLPSSYAARTKSVADDGAVNITIKCDGNCRSEGRRVGRECGRTCSSGGSPNHEKKKK